MTTTPSSSEQPTPDSLFQPTASGVQPTARFTSSGPVWSLRTLAAASVLSVTLAAGGGAALAAASDSSGSSQPGRGTGPGGITGFPGGPGTAPGVPGGSGTLPGGNGTFPGGSGVLPGGSNPPGTGGQPSQSPPQQLPASTGPDRDEGRDT